MGFDSIKVPTKKATRHNWELKPLIDCTEDGTISYGIVQPGKHVENGVPIIRVNNIKDNQLVFEDTLYVDSEVSEKHRKTLLFGGEILLTIVGTTGQVAIVPDSLAGWNVARAIAVIRPKEKIGADWIKIYLQSDEAKCFLDARANTTVQKTINLKDIRELPIPIPPTPLKNKIEEVESSLTKKIQLNQQINQTLEQMAQALFKSWFVDFEPVKAKIAALEAGGSEEEANLAAMQAISGKTLTELQQLQAENPDQYQQLHTTAQHFPAAIQDSELGKIPEGWSCQSLDEIATYLNGLALQKFRPEEGDVDFLPVLKIAQLRKGSTDGDEKASINIKPDYIVDNGDVIFSWSGSLLVEIWCGGKAALNQHLFKVTSDKHPKWLYYHYTKHHLAEFQRIASYKAVTMGHIKRSHLKEAKCALPSTDHLKYINLVFEPIFEQIVSHKLETNTLASLRDELLPKLLSGELSVADLEQAELSQ